MAAKIVNINFKGRVIYKRCGQMPLHITFAFPKVRTSKDSSDKISIYSYRFITQLSKVHIKVNLVAQIHLLYFQ